MKYEVLLWDADGTLFDFPHCEHDAILRVLPAFGLPQTEEAAALYSRFNDAHWKRLERGEITRDQLKRGRFEALGNHYGVQVDGDAMTEVYSRALGEYAYPIPHAYEVCRALADVRRMYVITNGIAQTQHSRFALSPLRECFRDVFISEEAGAEKPSSVFFRYVAERIPDFDPRKTLIIGDSPTSDIRGGMRAGIDTCLFAPSPVSLPEDVAPTYTVCDLREVPALV